MKKNLLFIMFLLSAFAFLVSCNSNTYDGTKEADFGSSKQLQHTSFIMTFKIQKKKYKIDDTIRFTIFTGASNYYAKINGELVYIANNIEMFPRFNEALINDPFDNFAIQLLSGDNIITTLKLPHFRRDDSFYWEQRLIKERYYIYPVFATHYDFKFKFTENYLSEKGNLNIKVILVSYKDTDELEKPIINRTLTDPLVTAETSFYFKKVMNYYNFYF